MSVSENLVHDPLLADALKAPARKVLPYRCSICDGEFALRPGKAAALVDSYRCCQCGDSPHSPEQGIAWKCKSAKATAG